MYHHQQHQYEHHHHHQHQQQHQQRNREIIQSELLLFGRKAPKRQTTEIAAAAALAILTTLSSAASSASSSALKSSSSSLPMLLSAEAEAESESDTISVLCAEWSNLTNCGSGSEWNLANASSINSNRSLIQLPDSVLDMDLERVDNDNWPLERIVSMIVPVFFGIIGFAGLVGNALVILVVTANQQMRSTTNLLIINLALSDILFVIFCVPFTATDYILPEWPFGNLWCKFVQYMIVVTCHCSVYTLVLMSFDRFLAVVHPVTSMSLRLERNAMIAILLAWILIVTTAIPVALAHSVRVYQFRGHNYTACVFSTEDEEWSLVGFQVSFFLSSYVVPLTLISFLYMGMLGRLWKSPPGCKPSAESRKGKRRVTRMVVVVVLAFAICWLPIHVILVLKALQLYGNSHFTVIIQIISHVLAYTNSCINPILYAFLSENFRKAFRKIVWCCSPPPLIPNHNTKVTRITATGNGASNMEML